MNFGVSNLSASFGDVLALDGVSLDVPSSSVVAVVGGDGAGKTTLLRCLAGHLAPTSGEVRRADRRLLGYMPSTSGTWRDLTVDENIDFVAGAFAMSPGDRAARRRRLLDRAGLGGDADRLARDLSGGMRQKLGFVMAVLHEPELLVLDEPSTGVDPVSRVELWRLIAQAAAGGAAVVMSTSYLDEAERASCISVLDQGRTITVGSRDEVMAAWPGTITEPSKPTNPDRAWRRGDTIREWHPDAEDPPEGPVVAPADLAFEDVVIARLLNDRQHTAGAVSP